jgi:hypothetical protein
MAQGTLDTLLRLRRMTVRDRMRELAAAIRTEDLARRVQADCAESIARETAAARSVAERDGALAGFAPWQRRADQALRTAAAEAIRMTEATQAARAALGEARGAMRAVEEAVARRAAASALAAQRSAQHALDDATRRPVNPGS